MTDDTAADIWVRTIKADALREGGLSPVFPKGLPVLLARGAAGEISAFANKCPHMGCPLTGGRLDGDILQCRCHDWRFDVRTGAFLDAPEICLPRYECRVTDGDIYIKLVKAVQ
jgi:3-phenylpropionate/trans-cinnamate dioxygenase ferredoxin subunit